jgi:hypothetical protein
MGAVGAAAPVMIHRPRGHDHASSTARAAPREQHRAGSEEGMRALLANGVGGREGVPSRFGWAVTGAAVPVVVSFVALG